jgi:hypothetical protein
VIALIKRRNCKISDPIFYHDDVKVKGLRYYLVTIRLVNLLLSIRLVNLLLSINNGKVVLNSFVMLGVIIGNFVSYPCI